MPSDPTLWLYTSLSSGNRTIITASSRIETILKANKIPFKAVDCATDEKARALWARRSKGKQIPGLVKFNNVIADLEQIEEWNEYGELEDQIEDQDDIWGDPINVTSTEAHAQEEAQKSAQASIGRTASETRHISISEPKKADPKKSETLDKKDTAASAAMKQASAEAAAKAGAKKAIPTAVKTTPTAKGSDTKSNVDMPPPPKPIPAVVAPQVETESEITQAETAAKTPELLAAEGAKKTSVDKLAISPEEDSSTRSTREQLLDQRRKSSTPNAPSALAKSTSISQSHTVETEEDKAAPESNTKSKLASKESQGSQVAATDSKKVEKAKAVKEEESEEEEDDDDDDDDEEDSDEEEDDDEDDEDEDDEEESEEEEEVKKPQPKTIAAKVSATNKEEAKVLKGTKPQAGSAKDASKAGVSVAD